MNKKTIFIAIAVIALIALAFASNSFSAEQTSRVIISDEFSVATFAGGCFWCSESDFEKHPGVGQVISGFAGGEEENPKYNEVASGRTSHREAVQLTYDPSVITYNDLLKIYWQHINPTDNGGQFVDRGFQYSTAVFYHNEQQKELAESSKQALEQAKIFDQPIVTPIIQFTNFFPAEEYHQDYHTKNPIRYKFYRSGSGRDKFIESVWDTNSFPSLTHEFVKPDDQVLRETLTPIQYAVTQLDKTEQPFNNEYWENDQKGIYVDVVSGEPLFSSTHKYKSGTGWPSFTQPLVSSNILEKEDNSLFARRIELRSAGADSHLGHVFADGPEPAGLRYCINSASLKFVPKGQLEQEGYGEFVYLFE